MRLTLICAAVFAIALVVGSSSGTAPPKPRKSLDAARLAGDFDVTIRILRKHDFGGHPGTTARRRWVFVPLCPAGPCRARATVALLGDSGFSTRPRVELARHGRAYEGKTTGTVAECIIQPARGEVDVRLKIAGARWIGENWRATRWWGTLRIDVPAQTLAGAHCGAGWLTASIAGSLPTG